MTPSQSDYPDPDISVCACANLRRAARLVTQVYDSALRPAGLRVTQFTMLAVLAKRGQMRQSDYTEVLGMDGTTLTRNLKPLLKNGWILIDRDTDQRVRLISLTKSGRTVLDKAIPRWQAAQKKFVGGLGASQWPALLDALSSTMEIAHQT